MRHLLNIARWLLFVTDHQEGPEPGSCAARITVNGEELGE